MTWQHSQQARAVLAREQGAVIKEWGGRIPVALAYPNTYYVGMSSLGLQQLYRLLNDLPDLVAERVFWEARQGGEPPTSLESQAQLADFAYLGFSVSFELDYFNLVSLLLRAKIPPLGAERTDSHPVVLAGGPAVSANPLPLAPIVDAFVIGEVEPIIGALCEAMRHRAEESRAEHLNRLAQIAGVYVPSVHTTSPEQPVRRQWLPDLDEYPVGSAVLTPNTEFGDMYLMEIARGCGRGCRFCLAGYLYCPSRERGLESLLEQARHGLAVRPKIGLVSAAVSDFSRRDELVGSLRQMGAAVSVSSLRADTLSPELLEALVDSGTRTLTFAPEAGSERLRRIINKGVTEGHILRAAEMARIARFPNLKLYFMVGLPGEDQADLQAAVRLVQDVGARFRGSISVTVSPFVPKAHTPYQRAEMLPPAELKRRMSWLASRFRTLRSEVHSESAAWSAVQGVLARGGPELASVLIAAASPTLSHWSRSLRAAGLDERRYLNRWALNAPLPWELVVDTRVHSSRL